MDKQGHQHNLGRLLTITTDLCVRRDTRVESGDSKNCLVLAKRGSFPSPLILIRIREGRRGDGQGNAGCPKFRQRREMHPIATPKLRYEIKAYRSFAPQSLAVFFVPVSSNFARGISCECGKGWGGALSLVLGIAALLLPHG